jgi:hypothetical protein
MNDDTDPSTELLADEMKNFREIAVYLKPSPGEIPRIDGIDIASISMPLRETRRVHG